MLRKVFKIFSFIFFGWVTTSCAEPITAIAGASVLGVQALPALAALFGTAAVGGGIAGAFGAFGGGDKERSPLEDIRDQLLALAADVPGLIKRRKEGISEEFDIAEEEGLEGIGEEFGGTRGFGKSSLESKAESKFRADLFRGRTAAELEADTAGLQLQGGFLGQAGGIPLTEQDDLGGDLLGLGGEILGQELGFRNIEKLLSPEVAKDPTKDVSKRKGELFFTEEGFPASKLK